MKEKFGCVEVDGIKIYNTTPHAINIMLQGETLEIPAAKQPLRLREEAKFVGMAGNIPLYRKEFVLNGDLPLEDEKDEILYIVPAIVAQMFGRRRRDLVVPHEFVRDANGNIIGCQGLAFVE